METQVQLCDYGCGKPAKYYFKFVDKWCCSKYAQSCGKKKREKPEFCDYGCGEKSKYYFSTVNKWCCSRHFMKCPSIRNKKRLYIKKQWENPNSKMNSDSRRLKRSEYMKRIGSMFANNEESRKKTSDRCKGKTFELLYGVQKSNQMKNHLRNVAKKRCLNGHSLKMIKAIKKISKPEIKLRNIVQELYPNCEFQHPILNFSVDVAILEHKIVIEYDGYYHFDTEEHKQYHKLRQEKIEKEGWKFLRYTMFDKFPSIEQVKEDIENLKNNKRTNNK